MNMTVILIFVSVAMTTTAQILLKVGMSLPGVEQAIYEGALLDKLWAVVFNLPVVGGVMLYVSSLIVWLFVLAKVDVTYAYPFVGLGFLLTMTFGSLFLGEQLSVSRISGTILVAVGVLLVGRS